MLIINILRYYITFSAYFENKPYTIKNTVFFVHIFIVCSFATEIRTMILGKPIDSDFKLK